MTDAAQFAILWPGDRRWLAFDVCSEVSEISGMPAPQQAGYRQRSDRIAHWYCDVGLPCISVLKHTGPFDLAANSAMAPFCPICDDTLSDAKKSLEAAARSGISCGWYCGVDDILQHPNAAVDEVLPRAGYRSLVYGPEHSGVIPDLARMLAERGNEVWVVSDGVTPSVLASVRVTARLLTFSEFEATCRAWTERSVSA